PHKSRRARALPRPATGSLRCKGGVPMIRVVITTFGTLHGPAPTDGDALLINLSNALRNPHHDPQLRYRNGLDPVVRHHVLTRSEERRVGKAWRARGAPEEGQRDVERYHRTS